MRDWGSKGDISSRKEAKHFLMRKGSKVAIQVGHAGRYVFVNKGDFIAEIIEDEKKPDHFCNYDEREEFVWYEDNILYVPVGVC